jgi:hypothetical protein
MVNPSEGQISHKNPNQKDGKNQQEIYPLSVIGRKKPVEIEIHVAKLITPNNKIEKVRFVAP